MNINQQGFMIRLKYFFVAFASYRNIHREHPQGNMVELLKVIRKVPNLNKELILS
jgi:hypothetical protein